MHWIFPLTTTIIGALAIPYGMRVYMAIKTFSTTTPIGERIYRVPFYHQGKKYFTHVYLPKGFCPIQRVTTQYGVDVSAEILPWIELRNRFGDRITPTKLGYSTTLVFYGMSPTQPIGRVQMDEEIDEVLFSPK